MPAAERVFAIAGDWVRKAENDLVNAVHTLKLGADGPTDTVCFHAQQCIEKYLKALLVLRAIDFPKTHDLEKLVSLLPATEEALMDIWCKFATPRKEVCEGRSFKSGDGA